MQKNTFSLFALMAYATVATTTVPASNSALKARILALAAEQQKAEEAARNAATEVVMADAKKAGRDLSEDELEKAVNAQLLSQELGDELNNFSQPAPTGRKQKRKSSWGPSRPGSEIPSTY